MKTPPTVTQIQRRYIDTVNGAQPRYRALVRSNARQRALRDLSHWEFPIEQSEQIIADARAIEVLERLAAEAR